MYVGISPCSLQKHVLMHTRMPRIVRRMCMHLRLRPLSAAYMHRPDVAQRGGQSNTIPSPALDSQSLHTILYQYSSTSPCKDRDSQLAGKSAHCPKKLTPLIIFRYIKLPQLPCTNVSVSDSMRNRCRIKPGFSP